MDNAQYLLGMINHLTLVLHGDMPKRDARYALWYMMKAGTVGTTATLLDGIAAYRRGYLETWAEASLKFFLEAPLLMVEPPSDWEIERMVDALEIYSEHDNPDDPDVTGEDFDDE